MRRLHAVGLVLVMSCGGGGGGDGDAASDGDGAITDGAGDGDGTELPIDGPMNDCGGTDTGCGGGGSGPTIGACPQLPADNLFNTPINNLPVLGNSAAFITTIGTTRHIHLDMGTQTTQSAADFYGIPYNIIPGGSFSWPTVAYATTDPDMTWNPRPESDCATGAAHAFHQPCTAAAAPTPILPIPPNAIVEGGVSTAANHLPYGDHHILIVDQSTCWLWETYHSYFTGGTWNIFGSAAFDLRSNALRPVDWTSADAAGFPILPLLLRADEASTGTIRHALRFTIGSDKIRIAYVWPARHLTSNGTTSTNLPPMGQLFRLKASYAIPAAYNTQARAILQAMKTYGMYIADGGSDMYVTGEPSAAWQSATFTQVQSVDASNFEAVDLAPIMARAGWSVNSGRVPPP